MKFQHFLLTRFNVPLEKTMKTKTLDSIDIATDINYLKERFRIFFKYTVPSVEAQTEKNFIWLILLSNKTPDQFKKLIQTLCDDNESVVSLYVDETKSCNEYISEYISQFDAEYYLSTRLDNDDAISSEFVKTIQMNVEFGNRDNVIIFKNGLQFDELRKILTNYKFENNHFSTLVAQKSEHNKSIYSYNHMEIGDFFDVISIDNKEPMWMEIVHSSNVSNRMHLKYSEVVFDSKIQNQFGFDDVEVERNRLIIFVTCLFNAPANAIRLFGQYGVLKILEKFAEKIKNNLI